MLRSANLLGGSKFDFIRKILFCIFILRKSETWKKIIFMRDFSVPLTVGLCVCMDYDVYDNERTEGRRKLILVIELMN